MPDNNVFGNSLIEFSNYVTEQEKETARRARADQEASDRAMLLRIKLDESGIDIEPNTGMPVFNEAKMAARQAQQMRAQQGIAPATFQEQPLPDVESLLGPGQAVPLPGMEAVLGSMRQGMPTQRQGFRSMLTGEEAIPDPEQLGVFTTPAQIQTRRAKTEAETRMGSLQERKLGAEARKTQAEAAKLEGAAGLPSPESMKAFSRIQNYAQQLRVLKQADPGNTGKLDFSRLGDDPLKLAVAQSLFGNMGAGDLRRARAEAEGFLKQNLSMFSQLNGVDLTPQFQDLLTPVAPPSQTPPPAEAPAKATPEGNVPPGPSKPPATETPESIRADFKAGRITKEEAKAKLAKHGYN